MQVTTAKVTSKGQITLPIEVRRKINVKTGDNIIFHENDGTIYISSSNNFAAAMAILQNELKNNKSNRKLKTEKDVVKLCKGARKEIWNEVYVKNTD
jgi:AbrB family looped-hinge helix DNA binding protein